MVYYMLFGEIERNSRTWQTSDGRSENSRHVQNSEVKEGLTVYKRRKGPEFIYQVETMNVHQQPVAHKTRGRGKQTFKDDMKKSREELVWKRLV